MIAQRAAKPECTPMLAYTEDKVLVQDPVAPPANSPATKMRGCRFGSRAICRSCPIPWCRPTSKEKAEWACFAVAVKGLGL